VRLSGAQRRLRHANDRLRPGISDVLMPIENGSAVPGLAALREIHSQIHRAFCEYQSACEERRQLAVDVGELAAGLTEALCAAGFTRDQARRADVHQLAQTWSASSSTTGGLR
jgi:hypothetical protein